MIEALSEFLRKVEGKEEKKEKKAPIVVQATIFPHHKVLIKV